MLSGWNCTPCTGKRAVRQPHDQAIVGLGGHRELAGKLARSTTSEW